MKLIARILLLVVVVIFIIVYWTDINVLSYPYNNHNLSIKEESILELQSRLKERFCSVQLLDTRKHYNDAEYNSLDIIYFITPTYPRPEQLPELTRLSHTLMHVPRLHWIVADDQEKCSGDVLDILRRSGLPFTHLVSPKPHTFRGPIIPRGVSNRRAALSWLHQNVHKGILYFGDDDNTVDLRLFDEIRKTQKVSMFPVGLIGDYGVSSPIVKDGKVVGFFDSWPASRTFPVDMAGFAVNIEYLRPAASMPYIAGYEEDKFLLSLGLRLEDVEPLADNCSKVLVWHTRSMKYKKRTVKANLEQLARTKYHSFAALLNETLRMGMADFDPGDGVKTFITRKRKTYYSLDNLP